MGSSPSPPPVQSASTTAGIQQGYNQQAAEQSQAMSNVNQETPFGNLTYRQTGTGPGGVPLWTASTNLSSPMQAILNSLQSGVGNQLTQGNYSGTNASDVVGGATSGLTKDLLGKETSYLQPYFTTQTQQLDTQLRNQGLFPSQSSNPGDPSTWGPYERAMNQLQQNQNQSVTGFLAQAEPAAFQQSVASYMLPLTTAQNEIGLVAPNYLNQSLINPPQSQVAAPNYTQAQSDYQNALNQQYAQRVGAQGNMMTGLFGIPTAVLGGWARGGGLQTAMSALPFLGA